MTSRLSVLPHVRGYVRHTLGISVASQNVTNKSFLVCVKSEKYALKNLESPPEFSATKPPRRG